jgi:hypothetical protein
MVDGDCVLREVRAEPEETVLEIVTESVLCEVRAEVRKTAELEEYNTTQDTGW